MDPSSNQRHAGRPLRKSGPSVLDHDLQASFEGIDNRAGLGKENTIDQLGSQREHVRIC
jgi:hypothetical protein